MTHESKRPFLFPFPAAALALLAATLLVSCRARVSPATETIAAQPVLRGYTIPIVDISGDAGRQVVVDREPGQYLGHPTTALLEDGRTIVTVYPKGHGKGAIVLKISRDGGLTWGERLPVPENWATSKETPTIHRVIGPDGAKRLIVFSGLYPARLAVSGDDGRSFSPLAPVGDWGGVVVMSSVVPLRTGPGQYLAMFHDDGRFIRAGGAAATPPEFILYKTFSVDGGLTWSFPEVVYRSSEINLCEPGIVRSPDGRELAALLRENSRTKNSFVMFSRDEGRSWNPPRELPGALTGDRHTAKYAPDGRLLISFRDTTLDSPTRGDWVAWVGRYEDIVRGREGQYRIRVAHNTKDADCAYPGVEVLPDGTFVLTTYGHWTEGEPPYILSVRFKLEDIDRAAAVLRGKGHSSRAVAVTMDDLPVAAMPDDQRQREIFGKLIRTLRSQHIPLIGFANESKLLTDGKLDAGKVGFLKSWLEAGFDLGNHTYAHSSANEVPIERYEEDILAGESVIRKLMADKGKRPAYFRPPFLHTGTSLETKRAIENFLAAHDYRMAPVTIDNSEWIFATAYEKAGAVNDAALMKRIGDEYVRYMRDKFAWYEGKAGELFGREIPQVLLIHANRLNADRFGELCAMIRGRGYRFVSLDEALKDGAYGAPDTFVGRGGISWIDRWALTAGKPKEFFRGEPRTPAYIMAYAGVASE